VTLVANSYFEQAALRGGLDFRSSGSVEEYFGAIENPDLWKFGKGFRILLAQILRHMRPTYELVREWTAPGSRDLIVAPAAAFGARIARERLGVPLVTTHLQPIALRTLHDQPGASVPVWFKPLLPPLRKAWLSFLDSRILGPAILPEVNAFRAELGLTPLDRPFGDWIHSPDVVLGLFPEWFAPRQPDWPRQLRLTGFPMYDEADVAEVSPRVDEFLRRAAPPILFTQGTGMLDTRRFFEESIRAAESIGRRSLLVTRTTTQIPQSLPDSAIHVDFVPYSVVLPRTCAFVHHGGVGTMAQGLRAGVPQLITPFNFDQPDNASRLARLGTGDVIRPTSYNATRAAAKLQRLIASPEVQLACRSVKERFKGVDSIGDACDVIEKASVHDYPTV
jgi:rhamnosyltransferase subunit B